MIHMLPVTCEGDGIPQTYGALLPGWFYLLQSVRSAAKIICRPVEGRGVRPAEMNRQKAEKRSEQ